MEKEILRIIEEMERKGWITINEHLEPKAIARAIVEFFKDIRLRDYLEIINPFK